MNLIEEKLILKNLLVDENYFLKAFPYLDKDLFSEKATQVVFNWISRYHVTYSRQPNVSVIELDWEKEKGLTASVSSEIEQMISFFKVHEEYNFDWMCDKTVEFVQNRKYFSAISDAADKYSNGELDRELPEKINKSLSITFDSSIGMDFSDAELRWEAYNNQEEKIPFLVDKLNQVTKNGVTRKTLNCVMSSITGGFKSGTMCSLSCDYLRLGYNVLYLSYEMSEEKIMERIDANMLDIEIDNIVKLGKETFINRINELKTTRVNGLKDKQFGKFKVKQYPTSSCHVGHIRNLLSELALKENFVPDVIMFDYIGIMVSSRYRNEAEHVILKAISEEVRGICVEYNVVGWTAMQSNRGGVSAGINLSIDDISGSYGTTYGFDLLFGLISSEEFDKQNKIMFRQLKNRYADKNVMPTFFLGLNKGKMKVFDMIDSTNVDPRPEIIQEHDDAEMNMFSSRYTRNKTAHTSDFKFGNA